MNRTAKRCFPVPERERKEFSPLNARDLAAQVVAEVKKAVVGKDETVVKTLLAILARGHVLLEDIPGVGKTTMAIAFSKALGLQYNRVQFTPDVMPSDLTGFSLYNKATGQMEYQPGALLCNLFLADELNRATSRTQSALLEAMEEGRVTVDGVSRPVPDPFLVVATQNPAGASGTQLLPDSQLDRFALRLSMGYPAPADELELLQRKLRGDAMGEVAQAAGINVDRTRIISIIISTVFAGFGQIIYLQNIGNFPTYTAHSQIGMFCIAALLVGGASVEKASIGNVFLGVILFHTMFILAPRAGAAITGDAMIGEYFRVFVSYGVITLALIMYETKKRRARSQAGLELAQAQKREASK